MALPITITIGVISFFVIGFIIYKGSKANERAEKAFQQERERVHRQLALQDARMRNSVIDNPILLKL